jgi:thiamine kinase-like enzyme
LNNIFNSLYKIGQILFKNKFIHRDFHYENLIVEFDGNLKLIDFQHLLGNHFEEDELNIKNPKRLR